MKAITATASRDGAFWVIYVPEVEQYTQSSNLAEAPDMARDLAATLWAVPIDAVTLESLQIASSGEV